MASSAHELRVASGSKMQSCVARALEALEALPRAPLRITAEGNAVCKAVSVAEIVKRRVRGLHQNTQIGLADGDADADFHDVPGGAGGGAPRAAPTVTITLSLSPLDPSEPGYQPPLTAAELHAAWIDDVPAEPEAPRAPRSRKPRKRKGAPT